MRFNTYLGFAFLATLTPVLGQLSFLTRDKNETDSGSLSLLNLNNVLSVEVDPSEGLNPIKINTSNLLTRLGRRPDEDQLITLTTPLSEVESSSSVLENEDNSNSSSVLKEETTTPSVLKEEETSSSSVLKEEETSSSVLAIQTTTPSVLENEDNSNSSSVLENEDNSTSSSVLITTTLAGLEEETTSSLVLENEDNSTSSSVLITTTLAGLEEETTSSVLKEEETTSSSGLEEIQNVTTAVLREDEVAPITTSLPESKDESTPSNVIQPSFESRMGGIEDIINPTMQTITSLSTGEHVINPRQNNITDTESSSLPSETTTETLTSSTEPTSSSNSTTETSTSSTEPTTETSSSNSTIETLTSSTEPTSSPSTSQPTTSTAIPTSEASLLNQTESVPLETTPSPTLTSSFVEENLNQNDTNSISEVAPLNETQSSFVTTDEQDERIEMRLEATTNPPTPLERYQLERAQEEAEYLRQIESDDLRRNECYQSWFEDIRREKETHNTSPVLSDLVLGKIIDEADLPISLAELTNNSYPQAERQAFVNVLVKDKEREELVAQIINATNEIHSEEELKDRIQKILNEQKHLLEELLSALNQTRLDDNDEINRYEKADLLYRTLLRSEVILEMEEKLNKSELNNNSDPSDINDFFNPLKPRHLVEPETFLLQRNQRSEPNTLIDDGMIKPTVKPNGDEITTSSTTKSPSTMTTTPKPSTTTPSTTLKPNTTAPTTTPKPTTTTSTTTPKPTNRTTDAPTPTTESYPLSPADLTTKQPVYIVPNSVVDFNTSDFPNVSTVYVPMKKRSQTKITIIPSQNSKISQIQIKGNPEMDLNEIFIYANENYQYLGVINNTVVLGPKRKRDTLTFEDLETKYDSPIHTLSRREINMTRFIFDSLKTVEEDEEEVTPRTASLDILSASNFTKSITTEFEPEESTNHFSDDSSGEHLLIFMAQCYSNVNCWVTILFTSCLLIGLILTIGFTIATCHTLCERRYNRYPFHRNKVYRDTSIPLRDIKITSIDEN